MICMKSCIAKILVIPKLADCMTGEELKSFWTTVQNKLA